MARLAGDLQLEHPTNDPVKQRSRGSALGVAAQTTYPAVPVSAILELMCDIGLAGVERLDGAFYQPLLVGTAPRAA